MDFLVVEDDATDAQAIARLMPAGVNMTHVSTLEQAMEALDAGEFNLILLDLGLPDSSGIDTFKTLQNHVQETPIVVLTGMDSEQLGVNVIRAGAQDYLVKSYLDQRALRALGFAVERDRIAKELQEERSRMAELEQQLRQFDRQIAHMSRVTLMGEVVGEIAHEVGQPLQAMANTVAAIQKRSSSGTLDPNDLNSHLEIVNSGLRHTEEILGRLRAFVKDSEPDSDRVDMNEIVMATLQLIDFETRKLKISVNPQLSEGSLTIEADQVQIQQVMVNLLRNAFDAIGDLEPERRLVWIRTKVESSKVVVEVEDCGAGLALPPEELFTPFRTTKEDGLGMGLAICSRIIQNHRGQISVSPGDRTTLFRFDLPEQA
ncbi:MAG: sensor histidine kinase [Planctomycetaceae bacterium]